MTRPIRRPDALVLSAQIHDFIVAHLRRCLPSEGVGLLAVADSTDSASRVAVAFYPGTNQDRSSTRYTMVPDEVLRAFLDIERRGWRLGGIVHSHPVGPATPSRADIHEFHYPEALMVIVSLAGDAPDLRAWWLGDPTAPVPAQVPVYREAKPRS